MSELTTQESDVSRNTSSEINPESPCAGTSLAVSAETETKKVTREKRRIVKNVILISVAFLFNFNAFQGLSRLQSSLNRSEGMGVITSSILYATIVVSSMFLPKPIIEWIGHKWTIAVSFIGYLAYMAANGYAVWATMLTASVLVGLCAAPLWTAQCSYFTIIGQRYASLSGELEKDVVSRFFGIFFMFFQTSSITGSLISATVLRANVTSMETIDVSLCGANSCPWTNHTNSNLDKPPSQTVWTMVGVYLGIACLAFALVALFVDNLPAKYVQKKANVRSEVARNFVSTFMHMRHYKQLLIIPLTIYSGLEQTVFNAELSQAYVGCSLGIWSIGLVTLPYGVANACMSIASGYVMKYTGRLTLFVFGMCVDLCIHFTLIFWHPNPQQDYVLYVLATMWGLTDAIWQTQINTLYGSLFGSESEAAFANYRLWESLGFIIAFAYSSYLCTNIKVYILTAMLLVGMCGYLIVEYAQRRESKKNCKTDSDSEGAGDYEITPTSDIKPVSNNNTTEKLEHEPSNVKSSENTGTESFAGVSTDVSDFSHM